MAINNNALYNAAVAGFISGALQGRKISGSVAASYNGLVLAAQAFGKAVDAAIPFDALISTAASNTMLVDTASNTIQHNTQIRPMLLKEICSSFVAGSYTEDTVQADYAPAALAIAACYTQALTVIVTP